MIEKEAAIAKYVDPRPTKVQINKAYQVNAPRDGICYGVINIKDFGYDGLDCCFKEISSLSICNVALEDCTCHMSGQVSPIGSKVTCPERYAPLLNDGRCQEFMNYEDCQFDGIDCCLDVTFTTACKGHGCACYMDGEFKQSFRELYPNCTVEDAILTNGECDPAANVEECSFDMGDCCMNEGNGYKITVMGGGCHEECFCHETQNLHFTV